MHPVKFVKEHPAGFVGSAVFGMVVGPWALATIQRFTGVSVGLPSFRGSASLNNE